jgi:hypothetical protein
MMREHVGRFPKRIPIVPYVNNTLKDGDESLDNQVIRAQPAASTVHYLGLSKSA